MSNLIFHYEADIGLCEDGVFVEDEHASNLITWDDLYDDIALGYTGDSNGFIDPEFANEISLIALKLRRLADRLDKLAAEKRCLPAI